MSIELIPDVITIDGPAASGKSTVGLLLAQRLGYLCFDTGSMYRALTLDALHRGVNPADEQSLNQLARDCDLDIVPLAGETDGRHYTVLLDGIDVTWDIRLPEVDANVSKVSTYPKVRDEMVRRQREVGHRGRVVMIGRDIGTVVMPDASLKLYITATAEERARRRLIDRHRRGYDDSFETILLDVEKRDQIDAGREYSPMRPADDAIVLDTTDRTVEVVLDEIMSLILDSRLDPEEALT